MTNQWGSRGKKKKCNYKISQVGVILLSIVGNAKEHELQLLFFFGSSFILTFLIETLHFSIQQPKHQDTASLLSKEIYLYHLAVKLSVGLRVRDIYNVSFSCEVISWSESEGYL